MKWLTVSVIIIIAVGVILYPNIKQMFVKDNAEQPVIEMNSQMAPQDNTPKFIPRNQIKLIIGEYIYLKRGVITDTSLIFIEGLDSIPPIMK